MQGLCSQSADLWAIVNFVPWFEALGTDWTARIVWPVCALVDHC